MFFENLFSKQNFKVKEGNLKRFIQKSNEKHAVDSPDGRVSPSGRWCLGSFGLPEYHFYTEASFCSSESQNLHRNWTK